MDVKLDNWIDTMGNNKHNSDGLSRFIGYVESANLYGTLFLW